jgi:hypothetical protein
LRALRRTRLLADSRLLDRLIRGRLWIPLVAAGLMGIVFMQVSMLKLNAGIGRAVQSASTLERQNANLRAAVSGMESGTRIEDAAHHLGMVVPADGSSHYVTAAARGLATAAVHHMTAADPDAILRAKAATAMAAGQTPAGVAATQAATAAAPTVATTTAATTTQSAAPTGTTAAAPTAPATTAPAAATTTPPPATTQPTGATAAPTTTSQPQQASTPTQQPQQSTGAPTAATTSGGAVAPPQG